MEIERDGALKMHRGNFDAVICITNESKICIQWWINNIETSFRPICLPKTHRRIESDSSGLGWGCHDVTYNVKRHGQWSYNDRLNHITFLRVESSFSGFKSFVPSCYK